VLVLTANTDANTPTADALRVTRHLRSGTALLSEIGGPHVVYGRGDRCVDDLVNTTILTGRLPARPVTVCPGAVADPYAPVPPRKAAGYADARETVDIVLGAVLDEPTYAVWSGEEPLVLGCEEGGAVRYTEADAGTVTATLDGCAWTRDVPVSGTVRVEDGGTGDVSLAVTLPFAQLNMRHDGTISGTFRGRPVR
jgi:hypothetical protein